MQNKLNKLNKFLWFSHFSGGGGSTLGAVNAGFVPLLGIEWDLKISELYEKNCGTVICESIEKVSVMDCLKYIPLKEDRAKNGKILVVQTSPPCQEYSQAKNYKIKNPNSESGQILNKTRKFYTLFRPEYVILENVRAYLKAPVYVRFKNFLQNLGYEIGFEEIVNCADYGVPQTRQRLITIFNYKGFPKINLKPTHKKLNGEWVGWYSAIEDLIPDLREVHLTGKQLEALKFKALSNCKVILERVGARGENKIREEDAPIWTLKASLGTDGKGANRGDVINILCEGVVKSLNVKCLARLQSFPDDYIFSGINNLDIHIIGNSVPPLLTQMICAEIKLLNT